jgi:putative inorganic carbon (HCO3(-)) transporter
MEMFDRQINCETEFSPAKLNTDVVSTPRRATQGRPLVAPYAALLLFTLIYFARPEDWIPGLSQAPLAKITVVLALLALAMSLGQIRQRMPREFFFLLLLVGQLFISSLVSPVWRGGAALTTLDFAKILFVYLLIILLVTTLERLQLLIFTHALSVSVIAAVAIWKGHHLAGRLEGVLGGNYTDPNDMALAMTISLPLCLALLFLSKNPLWKILWSICMVLMMYAIFLTGSRGGFLALLVVAAVGLWEFAILGRRRYLLMLTVLAGGVLLQSSGGLLVGRLKGTFNAKEDTAAAYASAQVRQQLFWRSIEITMEHPLFGVGPGNFGQASGYWHTTHNSLTLMSSEGGFPAMILYVLILWCGFKNLRATRRLVRGRSKASVLAQALLASLSGYAVGSLFLSDAYQFIPYILIAYTAALFSIARKSSALAKRDELDRQAAGERNLLVNIPESELPSLNVANPFTNVP